MIGIEEMTAFLRRSTDPDLLIAADYAEERPQEKGVRQALKLASRLLGFQMRSTSERARLAEKVARCIFVGGSRRDDGRWVRDLLADWIREVNLGRAPGIGSLTTFHNQERAERIRSMIRDHLDAMLRKYGRNLYLLISSRRK